MLERGYGARISPAVDGHRAWALIEGGDNSGSGAGIGVGEREGHVSGASLEWSDTVTKAQRVSVVDRSQKHREYLEVCM